MRVSDNRYERDLRRRSLAKRMIEYEARTQTIVDWTGLTKYQIQIMFREYAELAEHRRHRGASPFQTTFFSKSLQHECECAALATIELEMGIIPADLTSTSATALPGLVRGERLLYAFDLFCELVPEPRTSLEHAVLLANELAMARILTLRRCANCDGLIVVDRFGPQHEHCAFCRLDGHDPREVARVG